MLQRLVVAMIGGLVAAPVALAQVPAAGTPVGAPDGPVDQAFGDLDLHTHQMRWVDPGQARWSHETALRRLPPGAAVPWVNLPGIDEHQRAYVYEAPGVRAYVRRPEYLVLNYEAGGIAYNAAPSEPDKFRPLIAPDTVFDLVPREDFPRHTPPPDPDWTDRRLDPRVGHVGGSAMNAQIDGRVRVDPLGNADLGAAGAVNNVSPSAFWRGRRADDRDTVRELPLEAVLPRRMERAELAEQVDPPASE
jgi:hypothetical protein